MINRRTLFQISGVLGLSTLLPKINTEVSVEIIKTKFPFQQTCITRKLDEEHTLYIPIYKYKNFNKDIEGIKNIPEVNKIYAYIDEYRGLCAIYGIS